MCLIFIFFINFFSEHSPTLSVGNKFSNVKSEALRSVPLNGDEALFFFFLLRWNAVFCCDFNYTFWCDFLQKIYCGMMGFSVGIM